MIYEGIDRWNSPHLEHYGVPGMKWGVRKAVKTTGRIAKKTGKALVGTAVLIGKTGWNTGRAIRRFKNRRAIKSANPYRISKRVKRMTNEELSEAIVRLSMRNQIVSHIPSSTNSLGEKVTKALSQKTTDMVTSGFQTSIESIIRGESPWVGIVRDANVKRAKQEMTLNTLSSKTNSGSSAKSNIAESNTSKSKGNIKTIPVKNAAIKTPEKYIRPSVYGTRLSAMRNTQANSFGRSSAKIVLYDNGVKPVVDLQAAARRQNMGSYTSKYSKYVNHSDILLSDINYLSHHGIKGMKWGIRKDDLGDITVDADDVYRRREQSNSPIANDIEDRGYTYVYDPSNARDEEFYTQFGNRVIDKTFGEAGKIAGYTSAGKAFTDHIFETDDYHELKYTDTMFQSYQRKAGEEFVMSLMSAPYDSNKTPDENRTNYEERLMKYGAAVLGSGMGAKRNQWLDEEQREEGSRDIDTARNDAARRVADILKDEGYIGMRDFKDIGGNAGIETATILFDKNKKMSRFKRLN